MERNCAEMTSDQKMGKLPGKKFCQKINEKQKWK